MKKNNSLKIIASTSVTLFSLLAFCVSAFAWFTANRNADADGDGFVTANEPSKIAKVEIFSESTGTGTSTSPIPYKYNTEASATFENGKWDNTSLLNLGTYSNFDKIHTSLIVITLSEAETFTYSLKTDTEYTNSLVSYSNNKPTKELEENGNPLSSVIRFSNVTYVNSNDYTSLNLTDSTSKTSFVNEATDGRSFPQDSYTQAIEVTSTTSTNKIAIIVEYFPEALQFIYSINLGNDALNNNTLSFDCDWSIEVK